MYNMKDQIQSLLASINGITVYYVHPQQMNNPPFVVFGEYNNFEYERQGEDEYLSKIVIAIDVYHSNGDGMSTLAKTVNDKLYSTGLRRSYTRESFDSQNNLYHKSMLFKGIIQPDTGTIYQIYREEK